MKTSKVHYEVHEGSGHGGPTRRDTLEEALEAYREECAVPSYMTGLTRRVELVKVTVKVETLEAQHGGQMFTSTPTPLD